MRVVFRDFRVLDVEGGFFGSLVIEDGVIKDIIRAKGCVPDADITIDGRRFGDSAVVMPAFIDLHAHFREPAAVARELPPLEAPFPVENIEASALAAVAGGFVTLISMANVRPVIDTVDKAWVVKERCDALGLVDLYPVVSLTKDMEGRELSGITDISDLNNKTGMRSVLMFSEDGRDVADEDLFLAAMTEAARLGIPVSCHCDYGGREAETVKSAGGSRVELSRIEEQAAVLRAIELGRKAGCHIHIAHVSVKETVDIIRRAKKVAPANGFKLTCEASPHHIGATEEDARRMGSDSYGRVNPPLQGAADCRAIIDGLADTTIDAIATDHAPHSDRDKAAGAPGFSGLETAFAVCLGSAPPGFSHENWMQRLSALMSANPARILGLEDRGRITPGLRADLVIADTQAVWTVDPDKLKTRGKCTPFADRQLQGRIVMTLHAGNIIYTGDR